MPLVSKLNYRFHSAVGLCSGRQAGDRRC